MGHNHFIIAINYIELLKRNVIRKKFSRERIACGSIIFIEMN